MTAPTTPKGAAPFTTPGAEPPRVSLPVRITGGVLFVAGVVGALCVAVPHLPCTPDPVLMVLSPREALAVLLAVVVMVFGWLPEIVDAIREAGRGV